MPFSGGETGRRRDALPDQGMVSVSITHCGTLLPVQDGFAKTMTTLRKRAGYNSQNEAADLAGVSRTLWRNLEDPSHPHRPRRPTVVKVARLLRWDLEEAMRLAGHEDPPTAIELAEMNLGPRDDLDRMLRNLTDSQVRALVAFIEVMLNPDAPLRLTDDDDPENSNPGHVRPVVVQDVTPGAGDVLGAQQRVRVKRADNP